MSGKFELRCKRFFLLFSSLFLFSSCGYRMGVGDFSKESTFFLPFIEGDERGYLTQGVISLLQRETELSFVNYSPDYLLEICLLVPRENIIGYRKADGKQERTTRVMSSTEARITQVARVKLWKHDQLCVGPLEIEGWIDFDFESDFSREGEDQFSMGQLKMYNQAKQTAHQALAIQLAQKIVDSLLRYW